MGLNPPLPVPSARQGTDITKVKVCFAINYVYIPLLMISNF